MNTKINILAGILTVLAMSLPSAAADIPERFQGAWDIDFAATQSMWNDWGTKSGNANSLSRLKRQLRRMQEEDARLLFTKNEIIFENDDGDRDIDPVSVVETTDQYVILSRPSDPKNQMKLTLDGADAMVMSALSGTEPPTRLIRREASENAGSPKAGRDIVAYLNALKQCSAGAFSTLIPGAGRFDNVIEGRDGDRCVVRTRISGREILCRYSSETIALLTSHAKYQDAQNGVVRGSSDSEESRRASEECTTTN